MPKPTAIMISIFAVTLAFAWSIPAQAGSAANSVALANSKFGIDLLQKLSGIQKNQNVIISPLSISLALSMTWNGANGATKTGMAKALQFNGLSADEVNKSNASLIRSLTGQTGAALNIANSLWLDESAKLKPGFISSVRSNYNAELTTLKFNGEAVKRINNWVSGKTHAKIPTILDHIGPGDFLYLINAVYFLGTWEKSFNPAQTRPRPFIFPDWSSVDVPMLNAKDSYRYSEVNGARALRIPYSGGRLEFWAFLPKDGASLTDFVASLNTTLLDKFISSAEVRKVTVGLPKLKLEYKAEDEMKQALIQLGMGAAFSGADFNKMTDGPAAISRVIHKTFIVLDEKGTEAAAATVVAMTKCAEPDSTYFIANRPFAFLIRDNKTSEILFLGIVNDPGK